MRNLLRNKRKIYLCNKSVEDGRIVYEKPVIYKVNCQPLSTEGEIIATGTDYINRLAIYTTVKVAKNFHNMDRCYVYEQSPLLYPSKDLYPDKKIYPKKFDKFCGDAEFFVDGEPQVFINQATIYLQRMLGDDDE